MACSLLLLTETMTSGVAIIVLDLLTTKEDGGTTVVGSQTSTDCTSVVRVIVMVLHGTTSMLLQEVGSHFAIQT